MKKLYWQNLFDKIFNKISYRNRQVRKSILYRKQSENYYDMRNDVFVLESIETSRNYKQKMFMTILIILLSTGIVLMLYKYLFNLFMDLSSTNLVDECNQTVEFLLVTLMFLIFTIATSFIFDLCSNLYKLSKHNLLLIEMKAKRKEKKIWNEENNENIIKKKSSFLCLYGYRIMVIIYIIRLILIIIIILLCGHTAMETVPF